MSDLTTYQKKAKRVGATIQSKAEAGKYMQLFIDDEEVPEPLMLQLFQWIPENTRQETTNLVISDSSFLITSVTT